MITIFPLSLYCGAYFFEFFFFFINNYYLNLDCFSYFITKFTTVFFIKQIRTTEKIQAKEMTHSIYSEKLNKSEAILDQVSLTAKSRFEFFFFLFFNLF